MEKKTKKPVKNDKLDNQSPHYEEFGYSTTTKISQDKFIGDIITKHRAYLEIIGFGEKNRVIELGEGEIIIGRVSECGIQLSVDNVSREHARLIFHNSDLRISHTPLYL